MCFAYAYRPFAGKYLLNTRENGDYESTVAAFHLCPCNLLQFFFVMRYGTSFEQMQAQELVMAIFRGDAIHKKNFCLAQISF